MRTLDDVFRPGGVSEAGAAVRALHAAVASEEGATHAQCKAVRLVGAEEVGLLDLGDGQPAFGRVVVEPASHVVEVHHPGVLAMLGELVDLLKPLHLAVAKEGVAANEEFGQ